jgi:basic membrane lipoprotein Med (substrate-binding protein (PBP1-ABC) superfamily)
MLTSVMKKMDNAVFDTVEAALNDAFEGGLYLGTLENEGVDIAPFHDFEDEVPQEVKDALPELREGIISGEISVTRTDCRRTTRLGRGARPTVGARGRGARRAPLLPSRDGRRG